MTFIRNCSIVFDKLVTEFPKIFENNFLRVSRTNEYLLLRCPRWEKITNFGLLILILQAELPCSTSKEQLFSFHQENEVKSRRSETYFASSLLMLVLLEATLRFPSKDEWSSV